MKSAPKSNPTPTRPLRRGAWLRAREDRVFALVAELEYTLGLVPRGTRLVPTRLHRWLLRYFVGSFVLLIAVFVATKSAAAMLAALGVVLCAGLAVLLVDAWPGTRGGGGGGGGGGGRNGGGRRP